MSWTEINPYLHYIYPFFDYSYAYNLQNPAPNHPCLPFPHLDLDREYQNIKSYDTQPQLSSDRSDGKPSPCPKNRSLRKQKLLKKRVSIFLLSKERITSKERSRRKIGTCPPISSNTSPTTSTPTQQSKLP